MERRSFLRRAACGAAALALPRVSDAQPPARPNVIFILADDLGWMDTSVYGSRYYRTPNIDRLAARGVRFTDAYATNPLCSPTRASLLTGLYPARLGITTPAGHLPPLPDDEPLLGETAAPWNKVVTPKSRRHLRPEERTIGEVFRDSGYRTGFIGKWHLGLNPEHWPEQQGFEFSFHGAPDPGPPSYFSPYKFRAGTVTNGPDGEYITDRVTDEAIGFIDRHRTEPFFLCFWEYAVHAPFQAKQAYIDEFEQVVDARGVQDCPTMAGMIQSLDESIGRLLDHLDRTGLADNTILVLMSDNGGNLYNTVDGTTPTNNAPLRGGKANIYEGGVREPCVVVWPGVTKPGTVSNALISSIDFYPTLMDMAGLPSEPDHPVDGLSFAGVLRGDGKLDRDAIFCDFPHYTPATGNMPACSVRQGDWKLIRFFDPGPGRGKEYLGNHSTIRRPEGEFELYNLRDDISEAHNLAAAEPARVKAMDALITAHLAHIKAAVPFPNPNYNPRAFNPLFDEAIDGWLPAGTCSIEQGDGTLKMTSTGGDPQFSTTEVPDHTGPARCKIRLKIATSGAGQLFWSSTAVRPFHRDRSAVFELQHDGQWHEYTLDLKIQGKLLALRLDPGTAPGEAEVDWIRLEAPNGTMLKAWEFEG